MLVTSAEEMSESELESESWLPWHIFAKKSGKGTLICYPEGEKVQPHSLSSNSGDKKSRYQTGGGGWALPTANAVLASRKARPNNNR